MCSLWEKKGMRPFDIWYDLLRGSTTIVSAAAANCLFMSLWKVNTNLMWGTIVFLSIAALIYRLLVENDVKLGRLLLPFAVVNAAIFIVIVALIMGIFIVLGKIFRSEDVVAEARVHMFFLLRAQFPDQYPKDL